MSRFAISHLIRNFFQLPPRYIVWPALFSLGAAISESIMLGLLPWLLEGIVTGNIRFIIDHPLTQKISTVISIPATNDGLFLLLISLVFLGYLGKIILRYAASVAAGFSARIALQNLRGRLFQAYLQGGKPFFDRANVGQLHQMLMEHTNRVTRPLLESHILLNAIFSLIVYGVMMFIISWRLSLIVFILFPILHVIQQVLIKKIKRESYALTDLINQLGKKAYTILAAIPLVLAYTREKKESQQFQKLSNEVATAEYRMATLHNTIRPAHESTAFIAIIFIVVIVGWFISQNQAATSASLLVYLYLIMNITNTYGLWQRFQGLVAQAQGPYEELQTVLRVTAEPPIQEGTRIFSGLQQGIELDSITFAYTDGRIALQNFSLHVLPQAVTAIVGPSGSGKTTLINLLMRYYEYSTGSIRLDGIDIRSFTLASLRSHIALVSQDTILFDGTIKENIVYGLDHSVSDTDLVDALKQAQLYEFVMSLPKTWDTPIGDRGIQLSGGQRQRIAIARALSKNADILLFDEATSSLDSQTEREIQIAIHAALQGKTALVIAHRLSTIKNADKIVVIEKGKVVEEGSIDQLLAQKSYFYHAWHTQRFE